MVRMAIKVEVRTQSGRDRRHLEKGERDVDVCREEWKRNVTNHLRICEQGDRLGVY